MNEKEQSFSIIPLMYERISCKELLHSEIIAELLRPDGTHNCGDLFLCEFMCTIGINPELQDFSKVEIKTESSTAAGRRIDILIVWGNNAVIIENKLNNAADQPDQLKDYLKDTENKGKTVRKIVYIPLYTWRKTHEDLSKEVVYLYPQHLSEWLGACACKSDDAHDVASPYIRLLDYMNQSNRNYMKAQELYELLKQDPKLMETARNIANTLNSREWETFLCNRLFEKIENRLNEPNLCPWHNKKESELWLWLGNGKEGHKYWVSVAMGDKYYLYLYFYDETKPEGEKIERSGQYDGYYYYQLSDTYQIGDETDTEKLVSKIVELLKNSRR